MADITTNRPTVDAPAPSQRQPSQSAFISELERLYAVPEPVAPHRIVGGRIWNLALAAVLASIGTWVYRAPIAEAFQEPRPVDGRVSADMVDSFSSLLSGSLAEREVARQREQVELAAAKVSAEKAAADKAAAQQALQQKIATEKAVAQKAGAERARLVAAQSGSTSGTRTGGSSPARRQQVALPPVEAPARAALLNPTSKFYGVSVADAPFSMKGVDAFTASTGKAPNLVSGYQDWSATFRPAMVDDAWRHGALPVITWEPFYKGREDAAQPKLAEIAAGQYDQLIDTYAASVRDAKHPVGLRFAHEMNGRWYPWSEGLKGNAEGDFVEAWRHVHSRFQAVGATNVIWIWSPNVVGSRPDLPLEQVYPGDEYVDWMSLSGYYRKFTGKTPSFKGTFGQTLTALRDVSDKPILFGEVGVGTTVENRVTWLDSLFEGVRANDDIIGVVYFNHDKSAQPDSQDWRVEIDPAVQQAFVRGISHPTFGSGI